MAFGASDGIWGRRLNRRVQQNLGAIAQAIAQFEPVSMLVRPQESELARPRAGPNVDLIPVPLDDLWIRDSSPVFVRNDTGTAIITESRVLNNNRNRGAPGRTSRRQQEPR